MDGWAVLPRCGSSVLRLHPIVPEWMPVTLIRITTRSTANARRQLTVHRQAGAVSTLFPLKGINTFLG